MSHLITAALCAANIRDIFTLVSHAVPTLRSGLLLYEASRPLCLLV